MSGIIGEKTTDEEREKSVQKHLGHAYSLGDLCMTWSVLDVTVDSLFQTILNISPAQVSAIVSGVDNIASRCEILKRLIYAENFEEDWIDWLVAILNRVSTEVAPLRNRYIHDQWTISADQLIRIDKRAKAKRPQSREPMKLEFDTKHVADPTDVSRLSHRIRAIFVALLIARSDLERWRISGRRPKLDPQYLPVSEPNARYRTPLEHLQRLDSTQPQSDYVFD